MRTLYQLVIAAAIILTMFTDIDVVGKSVEIIKAIKVKTTIDIEMKNIGRAVLMSYIQDETLPKPRQFSRFLRENMVTAQDSTSRDPAEDIWGTRYRLRWLRRGVEIISAGPDRKFGTEDDLRHVQSLEGYVFTDLTDS